MFDVKVLEYLGFTTNINEDAVGIEIEMESESTEFPSAPAGWTSHTDNSLKAIYQREYVSRAIAPEKAPEYMKRLTRKLADNNCELMDSIRAGVHIHLNVLDCTVNEMFNIIFTYLAMERALVKFCGKNREGNLFCLRTSDAELTLHLLARALEGEGTLLKLHTDDIRYCSINLNSIFKHGTLEFRAMRTKPELDNIEDWVNILCKIREFGKSMSSSRTIPEDISFHGPDLWVKKVLGEELFDKINYEGLEGDVMKDVRNIQFLIYR